MFMKMKVAGLTMDPFTNAPIVILKDDDEKNSLPIWIGILEASAIAAELESLKFARPMTHDLIRDLFRRIEVNLDRVELTDLRDNVYYATLHIEKGGESHRIDARPSDAIALALRMSSPIFVDTKVLDKSRNLEVKDAPKQLTKDDSRKWLDMLEGLSADDFGKYKM